MSAEWQKLVLQFTEKAEFDVPDKPVPLTKEQFEFIVRMIDDEKSELNRAVNESDVEIGLLKQMDAFVDIIYYLLDTANRQGWNLDRIFKLVHIANMQKMKDGVKKDKSGKVVKPQDWESPDEGITSIIRGHLSDGSWK
jgi:predicted HAD superfamily Cof-like phosphohydrolase